MRNQCRRIFLKLTIICAGGLSPGLKVPAINPDRELNGDRDFLYDVASKDGSFLPGIDPAYKGTSYTGLSGIAAPADATIPVCNNSNVFT